MPISVVSWECSHHWIKYSLLFSPLREQELQHYDTDKRPGYHSKTFHFKSLTGIQILSTPPPLPIFFGALQKRYKQLLYIQRKVITTFTTLSHQSNTDDITRFIFSHCTVHFINKYCTDHCHHSIHSSILDGSEIHLVLMHYVSANQEDTKKWNPTNDAPSRNANTHSRWTSGPD